VAKLQAHLVACESCRVARDLSARLGAELQGVEEVSASPGFDDKVIGALFAETRERRHSWVQWKNFALGTAMAGLVMGLALQYAAAGESMARPSAPRNSSADAPASLQPGDLERHDRDRDAPNWQIEKPKQEPGVLTSARGRHLG
jgi:hypothetical protein